LAAVYWPPEAEGAMAELTRKQFLWSGATLIGFGLTAASAQADAPNLKAAISSDLDITGVATRHGRTFACALRRGDHAGPQLVEIVGGQPRPYPNGDWNGWGPGEDPSKAFVAVSALRIGQDLALWVLDSGVPAFGESRKVGGAKVVRIDLEKNEVSRTYDLTGVTNGDSLPAQIRFNGLRAYIADAGWPGIVVLTLEDGAVRRVLTLDTPLTAQRPIRVAGRVLRAPHRGMVERGATLIELSPDGDILYVAPPCGPMARIGTRFLDDRGMPPGVLTSELEPFAATPSSFGTAMDADGFMYVSDVDRSRILKVSPKGKAETLFADPRLACVTSMWIDEGGNLLMPAARLPEAGAFGGPDTAAGPFTVWSAPIGAMPLRR
jgi:Major royal jelly protein